MGPLSPMRGPHLEHTCAHCFPGCTTNACLLRVDIWYPKGGAALGLEAPYPLAIFTSGFLVGAEAYRSYAQMLASWGYTAILYDKAESAVSSIDDVTSANFVSVRLRLHLVHAQCLSFVTGCRSDNAPARCVHIYMYISARTWSARAVAAKLVCMRLTMLTSNT